MTATQTPPRTGSGRPRSGPGGSHRVSSMLGRRRRSRRLKLRLLLVFLLLVGLLAGGVWLVKFSSVLTVRHVSVSKTSYVARDQVVQAAQVPMGRPLADADLTGIGQRVAALAPVAEVNVRRSWPSTIRVQITERTPSFALDTGDGYALVDAEGIMFAPQPQPPKDLLVASSSTTDSRQLGDMATVVAALPPALRARTQSIKAASPDSITLNLTKKDSLIWGSVDNSDVKGEVALALLKRKGSVYNVTVPAHPTVK